MVQHLVHVGIVGGGAVAHALAAALGAATEGGDAYRIKVWARRASASASVAGLGGESAEAVPGLADLSDCDVLIVAVSDSALGDVAEALCAGLAAPGPGGRVVLHTSGAHTGAAALAATGAAATALGSLHPLVAVAPDTAPLPDVFAGRPLMVEATSADAAALARSLVRAMGGFEIQLPSAATSEEASEHKARYHALATMVATGVVSLVDRAAESMASADPAARAEFRLAYGALAASAVQNVSRDAGARVLTGAIARDDEALVERHREALRGDVAAPLYRAIEEAARRMLEDHGRSPRTDAAETSL